MRRVGAIAGLGVALTAASPARAQSTQACDAAYRQTQLARRASKLLDARTQALACVASGCPESNKADCHQWLAEIEASMPTVVFAAEDASGLDTLVVRLSVDGKIFAERLDGKAAPLDPGPHVLRFEMLGAEPIQQQVVIKEGEKNRRVVASFKKATPPPPPPPPPPAGPAAPPRERPEPPPEVAAPAAPTSARRVAGISLGALGIAALGTAGVLAALTKNRVDGASAYCTPGYSSCFPYGITLLDQGRAMQTAALVLAAAGAVSAGTGIALLVTAPRANASATSSPRMTATFGPLEMSLRVTW